MILFISMVLFSLVMSITPGPVNLIILSSSANVGFQKTFGFISGSTIGFTLLLIGVALGLNQLVPSSLMHILSLGGMVFLIYIGYKIFNASVSFENNHYTIPTFKEGFFLQWLNPKAWFACVSGVSMFSGENHLLVLFIIIYFFICYLSLSFWGIISEKIYHISFINEKITVFNKIMGSLLIVIALYLGYQNIIG